LAEAAPVEELPLAPVVLVAPEDLELLELLELLEAGVVAVVEGFEVEAPLEEAAELELAALEELELPAEVLDPDVDADPEEELLPQLVVDPAITVTGAELATVPVLSRMDKVMEVPAAILVFHVREVPVCWPRFTRGAAPTSPPGWMVRK